MTNKIFPFSDDCLEFPAQLWLSHCICEIYGSNVHFVQINFYLIFFFVFLCFSAANVTFIAIEFDSMHHLLQFNSWNRWFGCVDFAFHGLHNRFRCEIVSLSCRLCIGVAHFCHYLISELIYLLLTKRKIVCVNL